MFLTKEELVEALTLTDAHKEVLQATVLTNNAHSSGLACWTS